MAVDVVAAQVLRANGFKLGAVRKDGSQVAKRTIVNLTIPRTFEMAIEWAGEVTLTISAPGTPIQPVERKLTGDPATLAVEVAGYAMRLAG